MLCIARVVIGVGVGNLLPGTPLYQAEIAPSDTRGFMVGLHASFVGGGMALAQWIGVAFYHLGGQVSWRVPMALQCLPPLALLCVLYFLPESPRWCKSDSPAILLLFLIDIHSVYLNGYEEAAEKVLITLHKDSSDLDNSTTRKEFILMKAQIDLEAEDTHQGVRKMFSDPHLRKRFIVGWLTMTGTQSSGAIIVLSESYFFHV
jgi:MFS family permease